VVRGKLRNSDARRVYWLNEGAQELFFASIFSVYMLYQVTVARLDALQLVLVGTVLEGTILVFEIPTGVIADMISRRLSILVGVFITGLSFLVPVAFPVFGGFLLASALWGFGYTFTSGATSAWIVDEVGEPAAGPVFLRGAQVGQLAGVVGVLAGALIGGLDLRLPILLGALGFMALGLVLALVMPETGFRPLPAEQRSSWAQMGHTFREGIRVVRRRPLLVTIFAVTAIFGAFSEGYDRLWTAHLVDGIGFPALDGVQPVHWLAAMSIAASLATAWLTGRLRARLDTTQPRHVTVTLVAAYTLVAAGVIGLALTRSIGAAVVLWMLVAIARDVGRPLQETWLNQQVDSPVRATVLSMSGQMDAAGQVLGGPIFGAIGRARSIRTVFLIAGLSLAPAIGLYARTLRRPAAERATAPPRSPAEDGGESA
jgi:MFS transporter, DHA3 family, tetracycline resistance protein